MTENDIKKDLRSLSGLLSGWGRNVKNSRMLQQIKVTENVGKCLKYSIAPAEPLTFINIDLDRHCIPSGIEKLSKGDIDVEVRLTASYAERKKDIVTEDPIEELGVNIIINAEYETEDERKEVTCSWHLDKDAPTGSIFSHPLYHMNFGGSHMIKQGNVFGKLLLLAAPRIIHPPMDIILSCDFIIRNFYEKKNHQKITQDRAYITLLEKAKERYWEPYGRAFTSHWHREMSIDNLPHALVTGH